MRIHFVSLGCDKNLVDSEIMLGLIKEEGYIITQEESEADIIIINSCGFIADATQEGIDVVINAGVQKKEGTCKAIIVTGCMAQRYKEEIFKELPEVDAVVGTGDFERIGEVIKEVLSKKEEKLSYITNGSSLQSDKNNLKRVLSNAGYFAYLKIAEGCDNACTYCTIPSIRGKYKSRKQESIIEEAEKLAKDGVKELILVAQDTALYGKDLYGESKLHELLRKLSEIKEIEWVRIMYCYPEHITKETIKEMAENEKICKYLDMPIQHSDDKILKMMGRKSTEKKLRQVLEMLREAMPEIAIRTTLIVGFPNETEQEFKNLLSFVQEMKFDRLGVFEYSREEGTKSFNMANQVEDEVKAQRKEEIMLKQQEITAEKNKDLIGKKFKVIVDGKLTEQDVYCGRTYRDSYEVDSLVFFESEFDIITGEFREVVITESSEYDLVGEIFYEFS